MVRVAEGVQVMIRLHPALKTFKTFMTCTDRGSTTFIDANPQKRLQLPDVLSMTRSMEIDGLLISHTH